jgi:hypothetical protein
MNYMTISNAQYHQNENGDNVSITATIDGKLLFVPLDPANSHYTEILKQVADGTLTIADAD